MRENANIHFKIGKMWQVNFTFLGQLMINSKQGGLGTMFGTTYIFIVYKFKVASYWQVEQLLYIFGRLNWPSTKPI